MPVKCFNHKYRKLAASFVIVCALWGLSALHNTLMVSGSPGPEIVSIVQTANYPISNADLDLLVREAVEKAGGLPVNAGDWVVIKPNLVETMWTSGSGVVTDTRIVRTIVNMAQEAGASRVTIAEGSAGFRSGDPTYDPNDRHVTRKAFKDVGLDTNGDMIEDVTGAEMWDLNIAGPAIDVPDPNLVTLVTLQNGLLQQSFYVPNILLECDVLISVPTLKNHSLGGITGSLKNRVGCAPNDLYYPPWGIHGKHGLVHYGVWSEKERVNRATVDLERVRPSDFTVMDGLVGITNGPVGSGGNVTRPTPYVRCILAGRDATAVDTIHSLVIGYNPSSIEHLVHCLNMGFGQANSALITVVGKSVAQVRNLFPDGYGGATRVELVPPSIGDMTPQDGSIVSGVVNVTLHDVSDNVGVVRAELYANNELRSVKTAAPWQFTWDTTGYPNGDYQLKAKVYDAARNEASMTRILSIEDGWSVTLSATGGSLNETFTFGCASRASDGVDTLDVTKSFYSPYLSLVTLMGSTYYSEDYKSLMQNMGETREWAVHVVTDVNPSPSPITVSWAGVNWAQMPGTLELHLIDHGTSWSSTGTRYNMRDTASMSFPASGTGLVRCLTIQARRSVLSTIGNCKHMPDEHTVHLLSKVVTAGNDQLINRFYISDMDGTSGIQVYLGPNSAVEVKCGDMVNVSGTMATISGERAIVFPTVTVVSSNHVLPKPRSMNNRALGGGWMGLQPAVVNNAATDEYALGLSNIGMLVRSWGRVTYVGGGFFYMDDGAGLNDGFGHAGVRVSYARLPGPSLGQFVTITGISGATTVNGKVVRFLRPRSTFDLSYAEQSYSLANPGFETGTTAGWTVYGSIEGVMSGSWYGGITAHSGEYFLGTASNWGIKSGGVYQRLAVPVGYNFQARAWSRVYRADNPPDSAQNAIGIDPTGGTSPNAGTVSWSMADIQPVDHYSEWRQIATPTVYSTSGYVTVFLDMLHINSSSWKVNAFDDAELFVLAP